MNAARLSEPGTGPALCLQPTRIFQSPQHKLTEDHTKMRTVCYLISLTTVIFVASAPMLVQAGPVPNIGICVKNPDPDYCCGFHPTLC